MSSELPQHVGVILDGNRRWAREKGLPTVEGHRRGYEVLQKMTFAAADRGIKYISAYGFSTENWRRKQEEVDFLMELLLWVSKHEIGKYEKAGVRLLFAGSRLGLSPQVVEAIESAEARTAHNTRVVAMLCFNYGGRTEIAEAAARIVADGVLVDEVTPELIGKYLYHPEVPDVDLVVRTSGEQRLSGFMMWRCEYAELYFADKFWPDFGKADLDLALQEYANRRRRFGG